MSEAKTQAQIVKESISELIGVESQDIEYSNTLLEDLHMGASELTELFSMLNNNGIGIDVDKIDFTQLVTVEDLMHELDIDFDN